MHWDFDDQLNIVQVPHAYIIRSKAKWTKLKDLIPECRFHKTYMMNGNGSLLFNREYYNDDTSST